MNIIFNFFSYTTKNKKLYFFKHNNFIIKTKRSNKKDPKIYVEALVKEKKPRVNEDKKTIPPKLISYLEYCGVNL